MLFVGTKKQARDAIKEAADACGMPYVDQRWLGGLLTNFQTISKRIKRLHDLRDWTENGTMELLPVRERIGAMAERDKLDDQPRRRGRHAAPAGRDVRGRPEDRGDRRARGRAPEDPDHRARGHELRPGPDQLRDPGQRRRDPLLQAVIDAIADVVRERALRFRAEEEAARREREEAERREAEERALREAEEQRAPGGRGARPPRGRGGRLLARRAAPSPCPRAPRRASAAPSIPTRSPRERRRSPPRT